MWQSSFNNNRQWWKSEVRCLNSNDQYSLHLSISVNWTARIYLPKFRYEYNVIKEKQNTLKNIQYRWSPKSRTSSCMSSLKYVISEKRWDLKQLAKLEALMYYSFFLCRSLNVSALHLIFSHLNETEAVSFL